MDSFNEGASTSSAPAAPVTNPASLKEDKKRNQPWIEKYRPQKFEEIMGEKVLILAQILNTNRCLLQATRKLSHASPFLLLRETRLTS